MIGQAILVLDGQEIVIPSLLGLFGNIVRIEFIRLGAGSSTVFEDKAIFEFSLSHQIATFLEGFFGFASESDYEIAADGNTGYALPTALEHLAIILDGIHSLHPFEHLVAARLNGNVQILDRFGQFANGIQ